jgi:hypothetical protein
LVILSAQGFSEKSVSSISGRLAKKMCPNNIPSFFKPVLGTYRPIRVWFYIQRKLSTAEENGGKKSPMQKSNCFEQNFSPPKLNLFRLFVLFLIANSAKFKMQKEKSHKFCFYMTKMAVKASLVIFFVVVIHTALTVVCHRCWRCWNMNYADIWNDGNHMSLMPEMLQYELQ